MVSSAEDRGHGLSNRTFRRLFFISSCLLVVLSKGLPGLAVTCLGAEYEIEDWCCRKCDPGHCVRNDCQTHVNDTACERCTEGTFMNQPTARRKCFDCAKCDAGSGLKVRRPCTSTSDTACEAQDGFYCVDFDDVGCRRTRRHTSCRPGQFVSREGTALRDAACSDCRDGTFSNGSFASCQPHRPCESLNLPLIKAGTASADAECGEENTNTTLIVIVVVVFLLLIVAFAGVFVVKRKTSTGGEEMKSTGGEEKKSTGGEEKNSTEKLPLQETSLP